MVRPDGGVGPYRLGRRRPNSKSHRVLRLCLMLLKKARLARLRAGYFGA
jgi:hypothetical protein